MGVDLGGDTVAIIFFVLFIWLFALSTFVFFQARFFRRLGKGVKGEDLVKILKKVLEKQELNTKDIARIRKEVIRQGEDGFKHVQRLGLIRFNPFRETGGDHSFSLAVLDGENTGFIITGLHTRERTRIYLKGVVKGKSDSELSAEERKAFEKAQK